MQRALRNIASLWSTDMECESKSPAQIDLSHELSSGFAVRCIRRKAKQLVGRAGLTNSDRDDLEQDLTVKLLEAFSKFDPDIADWKAFVKTVVERHAANLLREQRAEKRSASRQSSLHTIVDHDEFGIPTTLGDSFTEHEHDARTGADSRGDIDLLELREDVATVIASLPEDLREICDRLKHDGARQVARDLNMPQTTICRRIETIREHFEAAGFDFFSAATGSIDAAPGS